jgi:tetratricopeptide (TPR) repeat protein
MQNFKIDDDADIEDFTEEELDAVRELAERVEEGETLQDAIGFSEDYMKTMEYYAHKLYQKGKYDEAGVLVDAVLALDRRRHYPYLLAGDVAMKKEQWEEAVTCLGAALEFGPQTAMVEGKLGEALLRVGRVEVAVFHLREAAEVAEPDAAYGRRARVLLDVVGDAVEEGEATGARPA